MRVALYIGQLDVGGAEGQLVLLARGLLARGHAVAVITEEGRLGALPPDVHAHLAEIPSRPRLARFAALLAVLRDFGPDVLHCQLTSANLWGVLAGRRANVPVTVISFLSTDPWKKWYHLSADRWLARRARGILANSAEVAARYRAVLGPAAATKIKIIYNGVDTGRFDARRVADAREAIRADELHVPPAAPVIINVANLLPVKDHATLLAAFAGASAGRPPSERPHLVLCGDGPEKEGILREAARLGVLPFVRLLGRVSDVERFLAAADIFVLSSRAEGFSNALAEAMAAGLACVATDVGGNAEALAEGVGIIVPAGDAAALAAALKGLLDDGAKREGLGTTARERAVGTFGLERMVDETAAWYRELSEGLRN